MRARARGGRWPAWVGVAAGVAAALALAGCGSSSSGSSASSSAGAGTSSTTGLTTLTRAAYVSGQTSGYRALISLQETGSGLPGPITVAGSGSFSVPQRAAAMTFDMTIPGAASALGKLRMSIVLRQGTMYLKLPAQLSSRLGGTPWLKLSFAEMGKAAGVPGLGSLFNNSSSMSDPGQYLDYLRAAARGSVRDLGSATVDGVSTEHYHAQIDPAKLPAAVSPARRQAVQQLIAALQRRGTGLPPALPLDAWIDSSHRVRRIVMNYALRVPTTQTPVHTALRMDFLAYGPQPVPAAPPAAQTRDLFSLLGQGTPTAPAVG